MNNAKFLIFILTNITVISFARPLANSSLHHLITSLLRHLVISAQRRKGENCRNDDNRGGARMVGGDVPAACSLPLFLYPDWEGTSDVALIS